MYLMSGLSVSDLTSTLGYTPDAWSWITALMDTPLGTLVATAVNWKLIYLIGSLPIMFIGRYITRYAGMLNMFTGVLNKIASPAHYLFSLIQKFVFETLTLGIFTGRLEKLFQLYSEAVHSGQYKPENLEWDRSIQQYIWIKQVGHGDPGDEDYRAEIQMTLTPEVVEEKWGYKVGKSLTSRILSRKVWFGVYMKAPNPIYAFREFEIGTYGEQRGQPLKRGSYYCYPEPFTMLQRFWMVEPVGSMVYFFLALPHLCWTFAGQLLFVHIVLAYMLYRLYLRWQKGKQNKPKPKEESISQVQNLCALFSAFPLIARLMGHVKNVRPYTELYVSVAHVVGALDCTTGFVATNMLTAAITNLVSKFPAPHVTKRAIAVWVLMIAFFFLAVVTNINYTSIYNFNFVEWAMSLKSGLFAKKDDQDGVGAEVPMHTPLKTETQNPNQTSSDFMNLVRQQVQGQAKQPGSTSYGLTMNEKAKNIVGDSVVQTTAKVDVQIDAVVKGLQQALKETIADIVVPMRKEMDFYSNKIREVLDREQPDLEYSDSDSDDSDDEEPLMTKQEGKKGALSKHRAKSTKGDRLSDDRDPSNMRSSSNNNKQHNKKQKQLEQLDKGGRKVNSKFGHGGKNFNLTKLLGYDDFDPAAICDRVSAVDVEAFHKRMIAHMQKDKKVSEDEIVPGGKTYGQYLAELEALAAMKKMTIDPVYKHIHDEDDLINVYRGEQVPKNVGRALFPKTFGEVKKRESIIPPPKRSETKSKEKEKEKDKVNPIQVINGTKRSTEIMKMTPAQIAALREQELNRGGKTPPVTVDQYKKLPIDTHALESRNPLNPYLPYKITEDKDTLVIENKEGETIGHGSLFIRDGKPYLYSAYHVWKNKPYRARNFKDEHVLIGETVHVNGDKCFAKLEKQPTSVKSMKGKILNPGETHYMAITGYSPTLKQWVVSVGRYNSLYGGDYTSEQGISGTGTRDLVDGHTFGCHGGDYDLAYRAVELLDAADLAWMSGSGEC